MHRLAIAGLLALGGCSFIDVRGPTQPAVASAPHAGCSGSIGLPAFDTVVATAALGVAIVGAATEPKNQDAPGGGAVVGALALAAIIYGFSAVYGYGNVSACSP